MTLLALFYLSAIPFSGLPEPRAEGTYLIVNKNLIEAVAVGVLMTFQTGRIAGLDMLRPPPAAGGSARAANRRKGMTSAGAGAVRHVTKLQFAYAALREAIIRCELKPGERLVIDDLARRFDVSIIPVREALRILESEGLIVSVAHTGTTVAPVSRQLIVEVFAILEGLETVSARAAAVAADAKG